MWKRITPAVVLIAVLLVGCTFRAIGGNGTHVDKDTALKIATSETPLTEVIRVEGTRELPFRHVIWGRDKASRELIVWVKNEVSMQVYVDQLISEEKAREIAIQAGLDRGQIRDAYLDHMMAKEGPVVWYVRTASHYVRINALTGEVMKSAANGA